MPAVSWLTPPSVPALAENGAVAAAALWSVAAVGTFNLKPDGPEADVVAADDVGATPPKLDAVSAKPELVPPALLSPAGLGALPEPNAGAAPAAEAPPKDGVPAVKAFGAAPAADMLPKDGVPVVEAFDAAPAADMPPKDGVPVVEAFCAAPDVSEGTVVCDTPALEPNVGAAAEVGAGAGLGKDKPPEAVAAAGILKAAAAVFEAPLDASPLDAPALLALRADAPKLGAAASALPNFRPTPGLAEASALVAEDSLVTEALLSRLSSCSSSSGVSAKRAALRSISMRLERSFSAVDLSPRRACRSWSDEENKSGVR